MLRELESEILANFDLMINKLEKANDNIGEKQILKQEIEDLMEINANQIELMKRHKELRKEKVE